MIERAVTSLVFGFLWIATIVTLGAIARVVFQLAAIGFTFLGLWPVK